MGIFHSNDFGGDPFPVEGPKCPDADKSPGKGDVEDEDSDLDDTQDHDLGGGD
jgi:hypothetical protein